MASSGYQQMAVMTMSMGGRLDELQVHDEKSLDTAMALTEIRTQLQELTKSVESCQSEVTALSAMISYPQQPPLRKQMTRSKLLSQNLVFLHTFPNSAHSTSLLTFFFFHETESLGALNINLRRIRKFYYTQTEEKEPGLWVLIS